MLPSPTRATNAPSHIEKTMALCLRIYPYSNTSHMVVWLTETGRRIVTSIKGAQRPKSLFLGQYDLFQTCELLYYSRTHDGVHAARECTALSPRNALRRNWRAEQVASWFSALVDVAATSDAPLPALFKMYNETLDALAADPVKPPSLALFARFEARLLSAYGVNPNFAPCPTCALESHRNLTLEQDPSEPLVAAEPDPAQPAYSRTINLAPDTPSSVLFSLADGCTVCRKHRPTSQQTPCVRLSQAAIALYEFLLQAPNCAALAPLEQLEDPTLAAATASTLRTVLRFLGLFLRHHLPYVPIAGRALALSALMTPRTQ